MTVLALCGIVGVQPIAWGQPPTPARALATAQQLRLAGKLDAARELVEASLVTNPAVPDEIALRLELARIHDRVGLHNNTRPVTLALEEIEKAAKLAVDQSDAVRGAVESALSTYYYRAEMQEGKFPLAMTHARRAISLLQRAGYKRAESDAIHQLGLIHLQRAEFDKARALFDQSLQLDNQAGERLWMLGEYHRHVAFIDVRQDRWQSALAHFEKSLAYRMEAGAIDASLFAAVSLASALVETGAPAEGEPHLAYALRIADEIHSPVGAARAGFVRGQMLEKLGQLDDARSAYEQCIEAAISVNYESIARRARDAIDGLFD